MTRENKVVYFPVLKLFDSYMDLSVHYKDEDLEMLNRVADLAGYSSSMEFFEEAVAYYAGYMNELTKGKTHRDFTIVTPGLERLIANINKKKGKL